MTTVNVVMGAPTAVAPADTREKGVKIRATLVSKHGPPWEQALLAGTNHKVLVSCDRDAPIKELKQKLAEKFMAKDGAALNKDKTRLQKAGVLNIKGAVIESLCDDQGYDIDEDSTIGGLHGADGVEILVTAEIDLDADLVIPDVTCFIKCVSKNGARWEQEILEVNQSCVNVKVSVASHVSELKRRFLDKFKDQEISRLNGSTHAANMKASGIEKILDADMKGMRGSDGYSLEDDRTLAEILGTDEGAHLRLDIEADLVLFGEEKPACFTCCGVPVYMPF